MLEPAVFQDVFMSRLGVLFDTIATYPLTQAALARDICVRAIADALNGTLRPVKVTGVSVQRYHPTLWSYVWTGLRRGIW